jgi:hypothetical protein
VKGWSGTPCSSPSLLHSHSTCHPDPERSRRGKDLLFAYAGNNARVAHSRAAFGPWVGRTLFPTHDDEAVMNGPPSLSSPHKQRSKHDAQQENIHGIFVTRGVCGIWTHSGDRRRVGDDCIHDDRGLLPQANARERKLYRTHARAAEGADGALELRSAHQRR